MKGKEAKTKIQLKESVLATWGMKVMFVSIRELRRAPAKLPDISSLTVLASHFLRRKPSEFLIFEPL